MSNESLQLEITVLDVSALSYAERLCAAALQGLLNRERAALFLVYGIYDDPQARRTNEVFLEDSIWYGKYRAMLGNQDQRNLEDYQKRYGMQVKQARNLDEIIVRYREKIGGCVVWDAAMEDTANVALMLAAQENLLPVETGMQAWADSLGLRTVHDLCGRWQDRITLYRWAYETLFPKCQKGFVACIEPGWKRPEFVDYLVRNRIFIYNLSSQVKGLGSTLLLLLSFGPAWLREVLFALHLDGLIRRFALTWMCWQSDEIRLNCRIQQGVRSDTFPTLYGWHTRRDDELTFMLLLSANGLRLVPSHLAGNFSFHAQVKPLGGIISEPLSEGELDPQGIYLTFTLSDGDQLMMMSTGELGNWYDPERGKVPFNWEIQPLLVEMAPALLEKYQLSAADSDCLVAGPSGAGYIIPPLCPDLPAYLQESARICRQAGVRVATTYVADPPRRVVRDLARNRGDLDGFLAGYAVLARAPQFIYGDTVVIANQAPLVEHIWDSADEVLASVQRLVEQSRSQTPCFIGIHLFAYRSGYDDVHRFAKKVSDPHLHIVRADTFLKLAKQHFRKTQRKE